MMLSICIPVYNFDVNDLINDLRKQILSGNLNVEIILIDDASDESFLKLNGHIGCKVDHYVKLEKNIGRSKIRNIFLQYSHSDYLLFLDCDGKIISNKFIEVYLDFIKNSFPEVVYGGRNVDHHRPNLEHRLRWVFAMERENRPLEVRLRFPYLNFQTNNFVIQKKVLKKIQFDEVITQYGYEDLVFSCDLSNFKIKIDHIENPILNNDIETNKVFLLKADQSAKSLAQIVKSDNNFERVSQIRLIKTYRWLEKNNLIRLFKIIYDFSKVYTEKILISGRASLRVLDFYKLGKFICYMK